jgi:hypothetical protein
MKKSLFTLFVLCCLACVVRGGDKQNVNQDLALDVSTAGPDFKVQGEYSGEITTAEGAKKLGVQIMALGGGTFRAVYYYGGLPGDGWEGDTKLRVITEKEWVADGKTEGDKTVFEKPYAAEITGETVTGKNDKGEAFAAKKVMRQSPTLGAKPPEGGVQLFDGSNLDNWTGKGEIDERKLLTTTHGNAYTKEKYTDFILHVEYMEPFKPYGREQDRGNSGVYLQNRYECQVLDSFGRFGQDNEAGGIYHQATPKLNMVFPPLSWQTYDIDFTAAKYDETGKKIKNATVTSKHNGVLIHENQDITGPTGGGAKETPEPGPVQLQGHGNPVFYRNIWIVAKK